MTRNNLTQVLTVTQDVVNEHPDYIDETNSHRLPNDKSKPGCLVGHILYRMTAEDGQSLLDVLSPIGGPLNEDGEAMENANAFADLPHAEDYFTGPAIEFLNALQAKQDDEIAWLQALASACAQCHIPVRTVAGVPAGTDL